MDLTTPIISQGLIAQNPDGTRLQPGCPEIPGSNSFWSSFATVVKRRSISIPLFTNRPAAERWIGPKMTKSGNTEASPEHSPAQTELSLVPAAAFAQASGVCCSTARFFFLAAENIVQLFVNNRQPLSAQAFQYSSWTPTNM